MNRGAIMAKRAAENNKKRHQRKLGNYNQSLDTGVFPNKLKLAKVVPIFKKRRRY